MKPVSNVEDGCHLTNISPILTCIQTLKGSDAQWSEDYKKPVGSKTLKQLKSELQVSKEDGFSFAVSLHDGSCVYTSKAITDHLGYPENMLSGQSMVNYLMPKDHITFANHLAQGLNDCFMQGKEDASHLLLNTFFCRFRVHQESEIPSGSDIKPQYVPFKITLYINELVTDDESVENMPSTLCVKATATRISFTYSVPEEIPIMASFSTQHTASCYFSHVDPSAIPYLGFLPQDMVGYSMFDFYHIDDMPQMKDIYELVVKERGSVFRSKPYRFRVQNGCYISLETEWSCFINPWSHKIEFVIGQHRVLKGPSHIDMLSSHKDEEVVFSDEILKDSQNIQEEIITLLTQRTKTFDFKKSKRFCTKRKRDLAAFANKNIDESLNASRQSNAENQTEAMDDKSNSEYNSTVMGDISPYREIYDSSVSPETPPAVEQLRYQETIDRFFASQPKTYSDGSDDYTKNEKLSSADESLVSSSGSGNGSGNTSASKCQKTSSAASPTQFNNKNNQNSSSSKCNLSSFTNGDSGYGKSFEKGSANNPSVSQAGSSNQMWSQTMDKNQAYQTTDAFSSCLSLTQESIAVHNKITHKHSKQHWKTTPSLSTPALKEKMYFQQKNSAKHKKSSKVQTLSKSTPTQTEDILNELSKVNYNKNSNQKMPGLDENTVTTAGIANPYMYPSVPFPGAAPFFIPVMYMGGMPYCPSAPSGQLSWPFGPAPPTQSLQKESPACHFQFPNGQQPTYPKFTVENSFNEGTNLSVQASGSTTAFTTTATVYSEGVSNFKKSIAKCKTSKSIERVLLSTSLRGTNFEKQNDEPTSPLSDMQLAGSLSSFAQSSSLQSPDIHEEMDSDREKSEVASPPSKMELTSELAYRYQMNKLSVEDILQKDREVLKNLQQPELVNKQLRMLQLEREEENGKKLRASDNDFSMTEYAMLGMTTEDHMNKELEYREECLLHLMHED